MDTVGHFIAKCWRGVHSLSSNIRSYSFVVLLMTGFGAWSVTSAIDALRQNGQLALSDGDVIGYKAFAGFCVLFFGAVVINQWYRLSQRMQHRNDDGTHKEGTSGTPLPDLTWPRRGVYISVGLMVASEILSRVVIFLAPWPHISLAAAVLAGFFAAFFTIPLFLTPSMTIVDGDAEIRGQQQNVKRIEDKVQGAAQDRFLALHLARIKTLTDTDFLEQYSGVVPPLNARLNSVHVSEQANDDTTLDGPVPVPQLPTPGETTAADDADEQQSEVPPSQPFLAPDEQEQMEAQQIQATMPRLLAFQKIDTMHSESLRRSAKNGKHS